MDGGATAPALSPGGGGGGGGSPGTSLAKRTSPPLWTLPLAFAAGLAAVVTLLAALRADALADPQLAGLRLRLPTSWATLRESAGVLRSVAQRHTVLFVAALAVAYVWKQTFAVPGSILLNALAGVTLGSRVAIPLVTLLSAAGATCGYLLSREYGGEVVRRLGLGGRLAPLQARVEAAHAGGDHAASFVLQLVSLRLFPGTPHWALNLVAPHAGVPLGPFLLSAALGMAPYNAITTRGGELIATTEWSELVGSPAVLGALAAGAVAVAAAGLGLRRCRGGAAGGGGGGSGGGDPAQQRSSSPSSSSSSSSSDGGGGGGGGGGSAHAGGGGGGAGSDDVWEDGADGRRHRRSPSGSPVTVLDDGGSGGGGGGGALQPHFARHRGAGDGGRGGGGGHVAV